MSTNLIQKLQEQTAGRRRARTRALRFMLAWAKADEREMLAVVREVARDPEGTALLLLLVTLADSANQTAAHVYPATWREQLEFVATAEVAMGDTEPDPPEPKDGHPTWGVKP